MAFKCRSPIRLGYISIKLIFPFLYSVAHLVFSYIPPLYINHPPCTKTDDYKVSINRSALSSLLLNLISRTIVGIIGIIASNCLSKQKTLVQSSSKMMHSKMTLLTDSLDKKKMKYSLWLCFLSLFEILKKLSFTYLTINHSSLTYLGSLTRFTKIFIFPVLNYYFFKESIYKHHWGGMVLIFIGLIIDYALNFDRLSLSLFLSLITYWTDLFLIFFEKWLLHMKFFSVFTLLFVEGICALILTCSVMLLTNWLLSNNQGFEKYENFALFTVILQCNPYLLITEVFYGFFLLFKYLTLLHFSPTTLLINDLILVFSKGLEISVFGYQSWCYGIIFVIVGVLIYNEIIVLEMCGLAENSRQAIIERGSLDVIAMLDEQSLIEGDLEPYICRTSNVSVIVQDNFQEDNIMNSYVINH